MHTLQQFGPRGAAFENIGFRQQTSFRHNRHIAGQGGIGFDERNRRIRGQSFRHGDPMPHNPMGDEHIHDLRLAGVGGKGIFTSFELPAMTPPQHPEPE